MSFIFLLQYTAKPVYARNRAQTNFDVEPIPDYEPYANFPKVIFPIFWLEESVTLNATYLALIKDGLLSAFKLNAAIKWLCTLIGLAGLGFSIYMMKFYGPNVNKVQGVIRVESAINGNGEEKVTSATSEKHKY